MFKVHKKEIEVAGKKISLETVFGSKKVNPDMDYFLLYLKYPPGIFPPA